MPGIDAVFRRPFPEAVEFFRAKLDIPTEKWTDLWKEQHARGFMVAGANRAELVADFRQAVDRAISEGTTLDDFRKDFDNIVAKHGWSYKGSRNWRSEVIYRTNLRTAHAAGRWRQLTDPENLKRRPYLEYRHGDSVHPRPQHLAWDGLVLPADDPWWRTHYPPNGWGCKCKVFSVGPRDLERAGKTSPDTAPPLNRDPETGLPEGIDRGWDYNVGEAAGRDWRVLTDKFESLPSEIARPWLSEVLQSEVFTRFYAGKIEGDFPVAVLKPEDMAAIGSEAQTVWLSQESLRRHREKHPEIGLDDYRRIPEIVDLGEVYKRGEERLVILQRGEKYYRAGLKRTRDGRENFFLTLFETTDEKMNNRQVRDRYQRIR